MSFRKPGLVPIFLLLALSNISCQKIQVLKDEIDVTSFAWTGGTVFGEPFQVTTKQLHFDTGDLFGKDVILEGDILERGESSTHLVMADPDGRILVVLTAVDESYRMLGEETVNRVKILGRLERGKKGLPYLLAKAVRPGVKSSQ
ncbi:hypothetical protein [Oligoflexus tunisiensis]|uniref:hypothetical protein n=1 Tax=Oligoflexus tunisiensis TaxID=708132 RepID=UPI00114D22CB|nr:hypothetical protein [Oligoflexus tunisiensis]